MSCSCAKSHVTDYVLVLLIYSYPTGLKFKFRLNAISFDLDRFLVCHAQTNKILFFIAFSILYLFTALTQNQTQCNQVQTQT